MEVAAALLVLLLAVPTGYGVDHTVGDGGGWTQGTNYASWAAGQSFNVGDNLVFNYGPSHSVVEVSKADYDACSASNALQTYTGGSNTVPITATGSKYYICPTPGHCQGGMKLAVSVAASGGGSTPTAPTTPSGSPPTTPPPGNGAAAISVRTVLLAPALAAMSRYM